MPPEELTVDEIKALLRQAGGMRVSKRRKGPTPGVALTNQCLQLLKFRRIFAFRVNVVGVWDAKRQVYRKQRQKGIADILGVLPPAPNGTAVGGRALAIEIKASKDKVSADQAIFLDDFAEKGGLALVIHNIEELTEALDREGY